MSAGVPLIAKPTGEKLSQSELNDRSNFKGKTVLISGCTNGLGAACVDEMCGMAVESRPLKIILVARNKDLLAERAGLCTAAGITTSVYSAELTDVAQIFRVAKEVKDAEAKLDIICLNAGMWQTHAERRVQADDMEVHYVANFLQMAIFATEWVSMVPPGGRIGVMGSFTGMSIAEGILDFDHLGTKDGEHKKMLNGAICYSQSKLAQHMWVKHAANSLALANGASINVCCPGSVMTKIDTWQAFKSCVGCCYPLCKTCIGIREPAEGCGSMMFILGSKAMDGHNGEFADFGMDSQVNIPNKPVPLEYYPGQKNAVAPSTADAKQCERLYTETAARIAELRTKHNAI
jgi:NAD(P)-dependent dehydrogenase (short-subunit alcohol dehydrogenase family)